MGTPVDSATTTVELLDRCLGDLHLGQGARVELEALRDDAIDLVERLTKFDHQYVPLEVDLTDEGLTISHEQWKLLEAGTHDGNELERLVTTSATLGALYRAAVDVRSFHKFGSDDLRIAAGLGDHLTEWHDAWDALKLALQHQQRYVKFPRERADGHLDFARFAANAGIIEAPTFEFFVYGDAKKWIEAPPKRIKRLQNGGQPVRYRVKPADAGRIAFLNGLWLNAHAAAILSDHLTRLDIAFELFTDVVYRAPQEIIAVSGDFDVLARAGDQLLMIECKSGRIDDDRGDLAHIVERAEGLLRVFEETRSEVTCTTILLFNHLLNDESAVRAALDDTPVRTTRLDQLRGLVIDTFAAS